MRLDETKKEKTQDLDCGGTIAYRRQYLANGGSPLNRWGHPAKQEPVSSSSERDHGPVGVAPSQGPATSSPDKGACPAILDLTTFVRELEAALMARRFPMIRTELVYHGGTDTKMRRRTARVKGTKSDGNVGDHEFIEAIEPIAHHPETIGNEAIVMRESVRQPDGTFAEVPIVTGDTMRHGLREVGAYAYLDAVWQTRRPAVDRGVRRLLFNGGMMTGERSGLVPSTSTRIAA